MSALNGIRTAAITALITSIAISSCKTPNSQSETRSAQTIFEGGRTLLWFSDQNDVYIRECKGVITDRTKETKNLEDFRTLCPKKEGTDEVSVSVDTFKKIALDAFMNDLGFEKMVTAAGKNPDFKELVKTPAVGDELVTQGAAAFELLAEYEAIATKLEFKLLEAEEMEKVGVLAAQSAGKEIPTADDFRLLLGPIYDQTKTELKTYQTTLDEKRAKLDDLAEKLKVTYEKFMGNREKIRAQFNKTMDMMLDPKISTLSVLNVGSIDFAIFSSVANRLGLLDAKNSEQVKAKCEAREDYFILVGLDGYQFTPRSGYYRFSKPGCDLALTKAKNGLAYMPGSAKDKFILISLLTHSSFEFEATMPFLDLIISNSSQQYFCSPVSKEDDFAVHLFKDGKDMGAKGGKELSDVRACYEAVKGEKIQLPTPATLTEKQLAVVQATNNGLFGSFNVKEFLEQRGVKVTIPSPNAQPNQNNGQQGQQGQGQTPTVTIQQVRAAIQKNIQKFPTYNADTGAVSGCKSAGAGASPAWSQTMQDYYCSMPINDPTTNQPSVRHCFTGAVRGEGVYAKEGFKGNYPGAADYCLKHPALDWIRMDGQGPLFKAVMGDRVL